MATKQHEAVEWSGYPDPTDPDNFWIDDETGERVSALTGERTPAPTADQPA
jgi:hypothetical protein